MIGTITAIGAALQIGTSLYGRYRGGQEAERAEEMARQEMLLQEQNSHRQTDFARQGMALQRMELDTRWKGAQEQFRDTLSQLRRVRGEESASHAAGGIRGGSMHSASDENAAMAQREVQRAHMQEAQIHSSGLGRLQIGREEIDAQRYFQNEAYGMGLERVSTEFDNMRSRMNISLFSGLVGAGTGLAGRWSELGYNPITAFKDWRGR